VCCVCTYVRERVQLRAIVYACVCVSVRLRSNQVLQYVHVRVAGVACGGRHTVVVTENGEAFSVGDNEFGQLGWGQPPASDGSDSDGEGTAKGSRSGSPGSSHGGAAGSRS
jgi:alpha-tubulin suppressor-like RCC1 family protein